MSGIKGMKRKPKAIISPKWSRKLARIKMKQCIDIPSTIDVHHIDFNPMNNDIDNLKPIPHPEHCRMHRLGKRRPKKDKFDYLGKMKELERAIAEYNNPEI